MKILILTLALLLCCSCETLIIARSLVSPEEVYRHNPASMNVWGPEVNRK